MLPYLTGVTQRIVGQLEDGERLGRRAHLARVPQANAADVRCVFHFISDTGGIRINFSNIFPVISSVRHQHPPGLSLIISPHKLSHLLFEDDDVTMVSSSANTTHVTVGTSGEGQRARRLPGVRASGAAANIMDNFLNFFFVFSLFFFVYMPFSS